MDEPEHGQHEPTLSSSAAATSADGPSSASPSTSRVQEEEEEGVENERHENGDSSLRRHRHYPLHHILLNHHRQQQQQSSNFSYRVNISISDVPSTEMRDDVWSCLVVLVTFWFFGQFHPPIHAVLFSYFSILPLLFYPASSLTLRRNGKVKGKCLIRYPG